MRKEEKIVVGISIGDLNGIGGELIIRTFEDNRMLDFCTPVVFASVKVFSFLKKHFSSDIKFVGINHTDKIIHGKINVLNVWNDRVDINFGEEDFKIGKLAIRSFKEATKALKNDAIQVLLTAPINKHNIQAEDFKIGKLAIRSFKEATKALKNDAIQVLLTAPINKHNIQAEDFNFPGHTDYLNQELQGDSLMFMISNELRVGLLTDHVAVKDVAQTINHELIHNKIATIHKSLVEDFGISKPKIAVLGINPHTGDNGVIGEEDDQIMKPALKTIRETGKLVFGPYSADSFFGAKSHEQFDAIIASYHDQGLIPFKTITFGTGVNFTAGLDKVRVSPDHGTAYEIAGKGQADTTSFIEALFAGIKIYNNRKNYNQLSKNPLKKRNLKTELKK